MADRNYPYTTVPGRLRDILKKAPAMGRPSKVTQDWLRQAGWTSSNDRSVIPVLRFVGLIGSDGTPTELWDTVRVQDKEHRARLAESIRRAYADLFALYPDAHRKDAEAIRNFFRANTGGGEQVQSKLVQTFQVLTEFADFDAPTTNGGSTAATATSKSSKPDAKTPAAVLTPAAHGLTALNVNIQLQLPATADGEVYDKLFGAMRKHLIGLAEPN
ncbi:MAG TPA: DUF5343 domain-containing protein [Gaiellaceae bacterium]|nr:DUF5343 domain-containing protein [Gaiellaceae bacterium]